MNWTKETPTVPGRYKVRILNTTEEFYAEIAGCSGALYASSGGLDGERFVVSLFDGCEWYGPIEPPRG